MSKVRRSEWINQYKGAVKVKLRDVMFSVGKRWSRCIMENLDMVLKTIKLCTAISNLIRRKDSSYFTRVS